MIRLFRARNRFREKSSEAVASLSAESSGDIWGASKDVLLYVRPTTLKVTANGYATLTRRRDVQHVISEFAGRYREVVARYRAQGPYPLSMAVEIRGSWTSRRMIERTLPHAFRAGRRPDRAWDAAVRTLDRLDPHAVFTSPLLRSLLRARRR